MTPEEQAEKLLTIDQKLLDKFLNDHVDIVRTLHNWVLARTEVLDIESINIMYQFFSKFLVPGRPDFFLTVPDCLFHLQVLTSEWS